MTASSRSLLDFVDAAIVVGDPDGGAVYVNPAFESRFGVSRDAAHGRSLSGLFEGGAREAVLSAVAGVCTGGGTVRFRLREGGVGYAAQASPIEADGGRVGVIILLTTEALSDEALLAFRREVHQELDQLTLCLARVGENVEGALSKRFRTILEDAARALGEIRKRTDELHALLARDSS